MQAKYCNEKNTEKCKASSKNLLPCSKDCGCYLTGAVTDIKKDALVRQKALEKFIESPSLSMRLSDSERQLLPGTPQLSLVCCLTARELLAREHDLEYVKEDRLRVAHEADKFDELNKSFVKSLAEAKAAVKSVESAMSGGRGQDNEQKRCNTDEGTKLLELSRERCRKMNGILDPLARRCRAEEESLRRLRHLDEDGDLDRAALKSALRSLTQLVSEVRSWERPVVADNEHHCQQRDPDH